MKCSLLLSRNPSSCHSDGNLHGVLMTHCSRLSRTGFVFPQNLQGRRRSLAAHSPVPWLSSFLEWCAIYPSFSRILALTIDPTDVMDPTSGSICVAHFYQGTTGDGVNGHIFRAWHVCTKGLEHTALQMSTILPVGSKECCILLLLHPIIDLLEFLVRRRRPLHDENYPLIWLLC